MMFMKQSIMLTGLEDYTDTCPLVQYQLKSLNFSQWAFVHTSVIGIIIAMFL